MKSRDPRHGGHLAPALLPAAERVQAREEEAGGEVLSWAEVHQTHCTRNGIYHRQGHLISLLTDFGRINACYPDRFDQPSDVIYYTGEGRHGDQRLSPGNRALLAAVGTGHAVPLFNKLTPGRWRHMGMWRVTSGEQRFDESENRMLWWFILRRAAGDGS